RARARHRRFESEPTPNQTTQTHDMERPRSLEKADPRIFLELARHAVLGRIARLEAKMQIPEVVAEDRLPVAEVRRAFRRVLVVVAHVVKPDPRERTPEPRVHEEIEQGISETS